VSVNKNKKRPLRMKKKKYVHNAPAFA